MVPLSVPVSHANAIRLLLPAVATPLLMFAGGVQGQFAELGWRNFLALGASVVTGLGGGDFLLFRTMRIVGMVRAYTIAGTFPLFGLVFAASILGERPSSLAIVGTILVVLGATFVTARSGLEQSLTTGSKWVYRRGIMLAWVVAIMWGIDLVLLRIGLGDFHPFVANSVRMPLAALVMTAFAWRIGGQFPLVRASRRVALSLLSSGILGMIAGSSLYAFAIQEIGAARTGALSAAAPVFAMVLAVLIVRERPTWKAIAGTLVASCGVAFIAIW